MGQYFANGWVKLSANEQHSLSQQISGQIDAGFEIAGFMEDHHPNSKLFVADKFLPVMNATRAILKD